MKIVAVRATPFSLQRRAAVKVRTMTGTVSNHVLIEIETDDGLVGRGEALSKPMIYGETQASIVAIVDEQLRSLVLGMDPFDLDVLNGRIHQVPANNSARAALDIALHDLVGQALGVPLYRYWGGSRTVQQVSWTIGIQPPADMAAEAERLWRDHGITAFKVKGGERPDDDVEAIRQIRDRLPAAQLSLDANEGYSVRTAIRTLGRMADFDLAYVEEPLPAHDRRGRVEVAREIPMPILGDDSCFTLRDVVRELELGAIGMVSIKTPRTGFWESFRILAAAEAFGVPCIVGTAVGGGLSSIAALHFSCARASLAAPSENSFGLNLVSDVVIDPPQVVDGALQVPPGPGLGVSVTAQSLSRHAVNPT